MKITVHVTRDELEEMESGTADLKQKIIYDLDNARDYSGFNVEIIVVEESE
ncbi:hypothetical protein [Enterobacter kobei]|uniref:hypothetical protein n=1 Tax=Enterobacter kobei TaxID=208224 RepID=UPI0032AED71B